MISIELSVTGAPPSPRSFHASTAVGEGIYIHGGLDNDNHILSSMYRFDTNNKQWTRLEAEARSSNHCKKPSGLGSLQPCEEPCLSHHCAINCKNEYIVLIGGWNGKKRTSGVFVFEISNLNWYAMDIFGEIPVGLSSHTANFISEMEILMVGREGGIHTQRRSGDAFVLNLRTGEYRQAAYGVDSRSGHAACVVKYGTERGYKLFVYSGRKTGRQYSVIGCWSKKRGPSNICSQVFTDGIQKLLQRSARIDTPEGRQNCRAICVNDRFVVIYGGQLWKARDYVTSDVIVYDCNDFHWYKMPQDSHVPKLVGFSMDIGSDGNCYVFGGSDGKRCTQRIWALDVAS